MLADILKAVVIVVMGLLITLVFLILGWYILWKVFFSRFSFLRELILGQETDSLPRNTSGKAVSLSARSDIQTEIMSLSRRKMQNVSF